MLSLDVLTLGVPDLPAARDFYAAAFSAAPADRGRCVALDLHGTGLLALDRVDGLATGFPGYVASAILDQPSEVEALLDGAVRHGATVLKPARKGFFGGFSAVYRAPDGAVWKLAAPSRKDTGPPADPPIPTETAVLLGVAEPRTAKAFYTALGMTVERDYGNKFVDFTVAPGSCRLGLMPHQALAKDAGVEADGPGFGGTVLEHTAASPAEVDQLLAAATAAGGRVTSGAAATDDGAYTGHFADPDGVPWRVSTS